MVSLLLIVILLCLRLHVIDLQYLNIVKLFSPIYHTMTRT